MVKEDAPGKAYKKRVIQADSDEEEAAPVIKRAKPLSTETKTASTVQDVVMNDITTVIAPEIVKPASKNSNSNGTSKTPQSADVDDDIPLSKSPKVAAKVSKKSQIDTVDSAPAVKAKPASKAKPTSSSSKKVAKESASGSDDEPLKAKAKSKAKAKPSVAVKVKEEKGDDNDAPVKPKAKVKGKKAAAGEAASKGKGKAKKEGDGEDGGESDTSEVYRWWDEELQDGQKWTSLEHNGVMFPPEYEVHGIKMLYNGKPVTLDAEAEEVMSFWAILLDTDFPNNAVFIKNFFDSWTNLMETHPPLCGTKITEFSKCDFRPVCDHLLRENEARKGASSAEKKVIKAARAIYEEPWQTCLLDGRREKVGNFRLEPPGLFRGRGAHPKTGTLKTRLAAEDITINISKGAKVPDPPAGHQWKEVVYDNTVTWLATWKENVNNNVKYIFLAPGSSLKGQSDLKKFEKARNLREHIARIRLDYTADLKSSEMAIRQRAVAIYFIDVLALRNGNEKGEDEADTVGCCSLRFEHITLERPNKVTFDFLGKDSIRYLNEVVVTDQVFKSLMIFKKDPKTVGDLLFDRLNTGMVNKYLTGYMPGLTAKVFRTYNASQTFVDQLKDTPEVGTIGEKILAYNRANRMVAVLCNHQKSVGKGHSTQMEKALEKLRAVKYDRMKLRMALLAEPGNKKEHKQYTEDESDIDEDWIDAHQVTLVELEKEKIKKKFDRENKRLVEENQKVMPESELIDRLKSVTGYAAALAKEKKAGWKTSSLTEAKILTAIKKIDERIEKQKMALLDKDEGKEVSLGTSKMNYLDPRITFAWCKKYDVPPAKLFPKTLIEKFTWAAEVDAEFEW